MRRDRVAVSFWGIEPITLVLWLLLPTTRRIILSVSARRLRRTTPPKRPRGRPSVHVEPWTKVSVVLFNRQIKRLDGLRQGIGRGAGKPLTRASLIRSLIEGVIQSGIAIRPDASESTLSDEIASRLRQRSKK
jgi:hypothetical protein